MSVSALGCPDTRGDGVFDKDVSNVFGNDVSNAFALFGMDNGGAFRTNELRRVGYPSHKRESRFRFFGEGVRASRRPSMSPTGTTSGACSR